MSIDARKYVERLNEVTGLSLALDTNGAVVFTYQGKQVLLRFFPEDGVYLVHVQLATLKGLLCPMP